MAPHSSTLAWKIPWMEELGGLLSMGLHRVGHDWATSIHFISLLPLVKHTQKERKKEGAQDYMLLVTNMGEGNGTPLQYSCLENPMGGGAWWAAIRGVAKSRTRLSDFTVTFHFHALEKEMATHSNVLAWRIPGTREPAGLPSMGSHIVGHDWSDLAAAVAAVTNIHIELYSLSPCNKFSDVVVRTYPWIVNAGVIFPFYK